MSTTLGSIAQYVRSKNAGPFWLTIDAFFADADTYRQGARSGLTDPAVIARIYGVPAESVQVHLLDHLNAIKVSFPRPVVQGSLHDADLHAGQQYMPLLDLPA